MSLSDAVREYLAVLDSGSYSTKKLANALDAVRDVLLKQDMAASAPVTKPKPNPKPAKGAKKS